MSTRHEDCRCPRTQHVHGSRTTYVVHKCRCDACREDNRIMQRQRELAKIYGRYDKLVDAAPVRAHVLALMAQGMGHKRIAAKAGLRGTGTITGILWGKYLDQPDHPEHRPPRKQILRTNADKLLAVTLDVAPGQKVDATGTRRRVQALTCAGWSLSEISRRLGIVRTNFRLHEDDCTLVSAATARAVRDLHDQLWDQQPPTATHWQQGAITRARRHAKRHGWVPTMAWDDEAIDDPAATPTTQTYPGDHGVHPDDIGHFMGFASDLDDLARQLGIQRQSLDTAIKRHGIEVPARMRVAQDDLRQHRLERRGKWAA